MLASSEARWSYICHLDEQLLLGGVILSEWTSTIVRQADVAFCAGADLAAILTAVAAIECHLKHEFGSTKCDRLVDLIDRAGFEPALQNALHQVRRYRNKWVHIDDPANDEWLLVVPEQCDMELSAMAELAVEALRKVVLHTQIC